MLIVPDTVALSGYAHTVITSAGTISLESMHTPLEQYSEDDEHEPHVPPQPSSPQTLSVQSGVHDPPNISVSKFELKRKRFDSAIENLGLLGVPSAFTIFIVA